MGGTIRRRRRATEKPRSYGARGGLHNGAPGTRFGVGLQASTIGEEVTTVMTDHFLTEFSRRDGKDLPLVELHSRVSSTGHVRSMVDLTYKGKTARRDWAHFPDQTWLSFQSIADALNELAVEMSLTAEHSVLLQMCMGKVYGSIMAQMGEEMDQSSSLIAQMRKEIAQMRKEMEESSSKRQRKD